ncbi:MAG: RNA polymerase sporulation sigma factor SigG [Bacilli bacterium]|nr:RNA polymerase sporulation sigma factor SigG [Bacilli bacterium]
MAYNKVEITGLNTSSIPVLTSEEMVDLFIKLNEGDKSAREQIAQGNLRLVLSILQRINHNKENMDDLFQIGCMGLMKAIDNFDLSHEVKFSTYAVPMIEGEIRRYLRDNNSLRVSRSIKDIAYKSLKIQEEMLTKSNHLPDYKEIADILGVSSYDVVLALESLKDPVSLFSPIYNDGGDTIYIYDQIEDKKANNTDIATRLSVTEAINNLSEREQFILDERFIVGKTQTEIAEELMISQAQVSRLEKGAIKELKKTLK